MFAKTRFREIQQVPISTIVLLKGRRISFVTRRTSSYILLYIALYIALSIYFWLRILVSCPEHLGKTILFFPHDRKIDTVELLLWDTSVQGTSPFRGHKIWSRKNVRIIFVFVNSIVWTPLFRGKGHFNNNKWLTTKIVDNFKCSLVTMAAAFKNMNSLTWIDVLHLWEFSTQHRGDKLIMISFSTLQSNPALRTTA